MKIPEDTAYVDYRIKRFRLALAHLDAELIHLSGRPNLSKGVGFTGQSLPRPKPTAFDLERTKCQNITHTMGRKPSLGINRIPVEGWVDRDQIKGR